MKPLSERVLEENRIPLRLAWKPVMTRDEISTEVAQLETDLRQALPYIKHMDYNIALAIQIEAHLEGREPWEQRDKALEATEGE